MFDFEYGSYAPYIWSAFGITAGVLGWMVIDSLLARLDQLSARLDATPEASRLIALETRVGELAATPAAAPAADPETLARIEQLAERVAAVDQFGAQLAQLNARVSAQAEFGAQLSSLRDRITELSTMGAVGRICRELRRRAKPEGAQGQLVIRELPTQEMLAGLTGTIRETVGKVMAQLAHAGIVLRRGRDLYILDPHRLDAFADHGS